MVRERDGRADAFAIDAAFAQRCGFFARRWLDPGAKGGKPQHARNFCRHRPGAIALREGKFFHGRAAQPTTRRQQGDRLDEIGFAGTIGPGQNDGANAIKHDLRRVVATEIGQRQALNEGRGHEIEY